MKKRGDGGALGMMRLNGEDKQASARADFMKRAEDDMLLAFATWAYPSNETDRQPSRASEGQGAAMPKQRPADWKSADTLWPMDVLAPFGGEEGVLKDLRENVFPDQKVKYLQPDQETGTLTVRKV